MRIYTVTFENVSVSAAQDLFEIQPADDKVCYFLGFSLSNVGGTADAGDAQEELLRLNVRRIAATATSGSGGTAPTPRLIAPSGAAAGFTAEVNNTTVATSSGTIEDIHCDGWNVRVPYRYEWQPECRPAFIQSVFGVVRLVAAPADAVSVSGTLYVGEVG